jgi:hypothetical protein
MGTNSDLSSINFYRVVNREVAQIQIPNLNQKIDPSLHRIKAINQVLLRMYTVEIKNHLNQLKRSRI